MYTAMNCTFNDLKDKEVISVVDGRRLGFISDAEIDLCSGRIISVILPPQGGCFSFFAKKDRIVIPWSDIEKIGDDIILVKCCCVAEIKEKKH